jgi:hypothetical protein
MFRKDVMAFLHGILLLQNCLHCRLMLLISTILTGECRELPDSYLLSELLWNYEINSVGSIIHV